MLSSRFITDRLHEYGDIQLSCSVCITRGIHDPSNKRVLQFVCALLNSGGGIVAMQNEDATKGIFPKHLDSWWSGMENNISNILDRDDICNFVDFVGNFDDGVLYLFVKSAEQFCSIEYNCRLPTDTATHEVSYKSAVRLCQREGQHKALDLLPLVPTHFVYGRTEETLKQEGKQIQFKLVASKKDTSTNRSLAPKVSYYSSRYISAFANHEGGHIYFGIEDRTAAVFGEEMTKEDEKNILVSLTNKMAGMIWGNAGFEVRRGVHWDVQFIPVLRTPCDSKKMVIVVSICKMYGGVFTSCPESYVVSEDEEDSVCSGREVRIRRLWFDEWKKYLLNQSRVNTGIHLQPKTWNPSCSRHPAVRQDVSKLLGTFQEEEHLAIALDSWGLSHPLLRAPHLDQVLQCLALFSSVYGLHVISLVDSGASEEDVWSFTRRMAVGLKLCLVDHGGCVSHIGIKIHVLDVASPIMLEMFQGSIGVDIYPQTYAVRDESMDHVLNALAIAIASYKPFGNSRGGATDHYFLLTCDQLELLWTHQLTKELWVHGPPGAGKTVAALEIVRELRRRGCQSGEILYVAENSLICSYVRSFEVCLVVSRRELMADAADVTAWAGKYSQVKNVIVDEAQNFKSRDGDWYSLLKKLSAQNAVDDSDERCGYFWLFMDYCQKVHKFEAGLPGIIGKNNFMLSEISRNTKEIFEYASKFMGKSAVANEANNCDESERFIVKSNPVLGHQFSSGEDVSVLKCDKSSMHDMLFQVLKKFSQDGVELNDMAILVSKKRDTEKVINALNNSNLHCDLGSSSFEEDMETSLTSSKDHSVTGGLSASHSAVTGGGDQGISQEGSNGNNFKAFNSEASVTSNDGDSDTSSVATSLPGNSFHTSSSLHGSTTRGSSAIPKSSPVLVSSVREFSGLDKSVIVGVEPHTNPDHADLEKLIVNLATRAKDSLIILTTSDDLMKVLKPAKVLSTI